ncbi:hypothetical protein HYH03_000556 [Edaphochlamys debaryana]|uniref:Uncharacterized protein n=1 Tax=Edaphochlamys debaryana TaxID=47281 RepID=A0A836C7S2_9CHLO|nr:hypothetical protein HYH03_000556 [Edaphochlamys debaryana]|eukprot:KAG2502062.1 hypothetical protein HYH03_000556 [Edaphochlamys debaryana]
MVRLYAARAMVPAVATDCSRWTNISRDEFMEDADEELVAEADDLARRLLRGLGLPWNSQPLYLFGIRSGGDGTTASTRPGWCLHPGGTVSLKRPGCASAVPYKLSADDLNVVRRLRTHVCGDGFGGPAAAAPRGPAAAAGARGREAADIMAQLAALTQRLQELMA